MSSDESDHGEERGRGSSCLTRTRSWRLRDHVYLLRDLDGLIEQSMMRTAGMGEEKEDATAVEVPETAQARTTEGYDIAFKQEGQGLEGEQ